MTNLSPMQSRAPHGLEGPSPADDDEGFSIDFGSIRGVLWRQRFTLSGIVIAALLIGFIVTLLTPPVYQATATMQVDPATQAYAIPGQVVEGPARNYKGTLDEILKSRSMSMRVVEALDLGKRLGPEDSEKPAGMSEADWTAAKARKVAARMPDGLTVSSSPVSSIVAISYSSKDPKLAAAIANAYVDAFLRDGIERNIEKSEFARNYLQEQIHKLQAKLANAERQSISFARSARIVGPGMIGASSPSATGDADTAQTSTPATLQGSNLLAINEAYVAARTARIAAEQRWNAIRNVSPLNISEVQQNSTIAALSAQRSAAVTKLAELRARYGDEYPQARELQVQVANLDQQIQQRGNEIKNGIRTAYELAQRQEAAFADEVSRVSGQTLDEQSRRVQLTQLERESEANRNQLNAMLKRYNDLTATANVTPSEFTKLDAAVPSSKPVSPVLTKNLLIAAILGIGLAVAVAILLEIFDDRLRSIDDLERKIRLPGLGITPLVSEDGHASSLDEAYASITTAITFMLPNREQNIVSFTSSQQGEGKSTTAFNVARKLASHGRKVLLIDADLRKPSIAALAGYSRPKQGLAEVLLGEIAFADALLPNDVQNFDVLPTGTIPTQPVEVLSSPLFADFLMQCRQNYSVIVIDSPPVIGLADAPIIASLADCSVFIIEANRIHFGQVKAALRRLRNSNANIIGAVMTKFQASAAGQGYGYEYNYYTYGSDSARPDA